MPATLLTDYFEAGCIPGKRFLRRRKKSRIAAGFVVSASVPRSMKSSESGLTLLSRHREKNLGDDRNNVNNDAHANRDVAPHIGLF